MQAVFWHGNPWIKRFQFKSICFTARKLNMCTKKNALFICFIKKEHHINMKIEQNNLWELNKRSMSDPNCSMWHRPNFGWVLYFNSYIYGTNVHNEKGHGDKEYISGENFVYHNIIVITCTTYFFQKVVKNKYPGVQHVQTTHA